MPEKSNNKREYVEITGNEFGEFYQWSQKGESVEGMLTGRRTIKTKFGDQVVYGLRKDNGQNLTLTGTANLVPKLDKISPGDFVRITYTGDLQVKAGTMLVFKVEASAGDTKDTTPF